MTPDKWQAFFLDTFGYELVTDQSTGSKAIVVEGGGHVVLRDPETKELYNIESPFQAARFLALEKNPSNLKDYKTSPAFNLEWALEFYRTHLITALTRYLAFAVIEDDRNTVKAILDEYPELLLFKGVRLCVTSELTTQSFSVSNILGIACRRKQIEMVKILLPYFNKLQEGKTEEEVKEMTNIKDVGLAEWLEYPLDAAKNIQIPADYQALINGLIDVFKVENIAPNTPVKTLSAEVETAMNVLYERLLPGITNPELAPENRPVTTKENHLDVELLLLAAYKAYVERYGEFQTGEQRDAYCIRVIGIVQNFLPPETGKIFCEGLYYVVEKNRQISERAKGLKLADGSTNFYGPLDLALRKGLGFDYLCGDFVARLHDWFGAAKGGGGHVEKICQTKTTTFRNLPSDTSIRHISRTPSLISPGV